MPAQEDRTYDFLVLVRLRGALRLIGNGVVRWFDPRARRRAEEARAFRIFQAIMTETCEQCMAPLTVCRRTHWLPNHDTYIV